MQDDLKILFVEDVPIDQELAERQLKTNGIQFNSLRVDSKDEFLQALQSFKPNLIISDYVMPGFDGMQALNFTREFSPETPFIVLTGSMNEDTAVECMKAGADDYVIKEHINRLPFAVREALKHRKKLQEKNDAEQMLIESESKFRSLFQNNHTVMLLIDPVDGDIIEANPAACKFYGFKKDQLVGKKITEINPMPLEKILLLLQKAITQERSSFYFQHRLSNGELRDVEVYSGPIEHVGKTLLYEIVHDVTVRKQVEDQIRLQAAALNAVENVIMITDTDGLIQWVNPAFTKLTGYSFEEVLGQNPRFLKSGRQDQSYYQKLWQTILSGNIWQGELINKRKDGSYYTEEETITPLNDEDGNITQFIAIKEDITQQKLSEMALRKSEERYRSLFDDSPVSIFEEDLSAVKIRLEELRQSGVKDFRKYLHENPDELIEITNLIKITDGNKEAEKLLGFQSRQEFLNYLSKGLTPFNNFMMLDEIVNIANGQTKFQTEIIRPNSNGKTLYLNVNWSVVPGYEDDLSKVIVSIVDITERIELENRQQQRLIELEAIDKITAALREATSLDEALPIFLQQTLGMMNIETGGIWLFNQTLGSLQVAQVIGWQNDIQDVEIKPGDGIIGSVFLSGLSSCYSDFDSIPEIKPCSELQLNHGVGGICVPIQSQEKILGVMLIVYPQDREVKDDEIRLLESFARIAGITLQRMTLYEDTLIHLKQLQLQRTIDHTIASIFDLNLSLEIICSQAKNHLNADAVGILLFHQSANTLIYKASSGFRTAHYKNSRIPLGVGLAGKAALNREIIKVNDLHKSDPPYRNKSLLEEEQFESYLVAPLVAKGQIKGVLEIFFRSSHSIYPDMDEFINSLALQTAIAIDNLQLFDNLQFSNLELIQAYDATIEGWSRAMDLRDKETEDHTRRVTDMTIRMAQMLNLPEEEITQMHRGALLHDIGKMGVPDEILHKPGPLTPDEWIIMKQHPVFAYEMIAPIEYLKPALDIPYCHHEKWDGSGYPRGLKGKEIPIAARIFALIDVWDALSSDRPYREAWPKQKVLDYIKQQSGTHFDPEIAKVFIQFIESEDWSML